MESSQSKGTHVLKDSAEESQKEWDLFVCYASEDNDEVVRPLVKALVEKGLRVWYDKFSLTIGDSLSGSIDRGLAQSKYGLVILSPNFFAKEWPQRELDALVSIEARSGKKILPIWHRLSHDDVARFSPLLADKLAISTSKGLDALTEEIIRAVKPKKAELSGIEKHLFLAGCVVGNNLAIAPITPESDPNELDKVIEILRAIGLAEAPETKAIIKTRNMLIQNKGKSLDKDTFRKIWNSYFDAMHKLPDRIRARTSSEAFRWFKIGELLYDLITSAYIDRYHRELKTPQAKPALSVVTKAAALETLIKQVDLPIHIRREIENLTDAIKAGNATLSEDMLNLQYSNVNFIAQALFAWLDATT
ncbi:MAG: toll/interleukin-1 receptor domain-containing protein [Candidatus Bathyarchaeia archaeon]